ncbi:MAG: hypothetical protein ACI8RA_002873, partial [Chlamydiales bacterium]
TCSEVKVISFLLAVNLCLGSLKVPGASCKGTKM